MALGALTGHVVAASLPCPGDAAAAGPSHPHDATSGHVHEGGHGQVHEGSHRHAPATDAWLAASCGCGCGEGAPPSPARSRLWLGVPSAEPVLAARGLATPLEPAGASPAPAPELADEPIPI